MTETFPTELIETIPGFIGLEDERELFTRASQVPRDGFILELGSAFGRSAAALALGNPTARIMSVDMYWQEIGERAPEVDFSPAGNTARLAKLGIHNVSFIQDNTLTMPTPNEDENDPFPIDLLWHDCSHTYEDVIHDLNKFGGFAKVIMVHDYTESQVSPVPGIIQFPGVTRAVDQYLYEHPEFHIIHHIWSTVTLGRK
jgi:hypothetical protein